MTSGTHSIVLPRGTDIATWHTCNNFFFFLQKTILKNYKKSKSDIGALLTP